MSSLGMWRGLQRAQRAFDAVRADAASTLEQRLEAASDLRLARELYDDACAYDRIEARAEMDAGE